MLGELNEAMNTYEALGGFDPDDVDLEGAVIDTRAEVAKLVQRHSDVWAVFKEIRNRNDIEAFEQLLAADDVRQGFYDALRDYQGTLAVALATEHFYAETPKDRIRAYKDDLKFFRSLRASVKQRYAEAIDYAQYETQIRKVMDSHIQAPDVGVITELVNIFDVEAFDQEVEKRHGTAAKADTIASRLKKTIHEKMEEDPVFYCKFAERLERCWERTRAEGFPSPPIVVRRLRSRWGSCSPAGRIVLNTALIKAPKECIDYVITHELCHLKAPHHGPAFWRLLERLMPDYRARRRRLNLMADV